MDFLKGILHPQGLVAHSELTLMIQATALMLVVLVPVYILIFFFAWYYRAGNTKAKYVPNWQHAKLDELVWWAIPFEIILVLGALTWTSTHQLDPKQPLAISGEPMIVEVVALPWKWLFIYPKEHIATVNYVAFPKDRPIQFQITADAPMNSFWIPELGGQIYAMTGMVTHLTLASDKEGSYQGMSANYSGEGFADMKFKAQSMSEDEFDLWVTEMHAQSHYLEKGAYQTLAKPGTSTVMYYSEISPTLFDDIVRKFNHAR
ncbi:ubiquinol oxidase subunit II [Candidatus Parcubacteria bacterium]|nr:ubiquinol oxidase subunit II [Candidatus Parcubacteria bacterium]